MKAICTDKYIIPISSVNYVERYHGTAIAVYLKNPRCRHYSLISRI